MINKLFKSPRLLNKDSDKNIKITPLSNYKFTSTMNSISLSTNEIAEAGKHYPIMFIKNSDGVIPIAILSLKENENNFVNKDGNWNKNRYIPALFRAYPFALSKTGDNLSIALDSGYDGIDKKDGKAFFNEDGSNNELGTQVSKFLQETYGALEVTKNLTKIIDDLELFKEVELKVEHNKNNFLLKGVLQIDQEKLNKLDDKSLLKLTKSGAFNTIYSHLNSMSNITNLF